MKLYQLVVPAVLAAGQALAGGPKADPASIASDEAAFNRLRADIARKNAAHQPVRAGRRQQAPQGCEFKPVMTDREIAACKKK